jgi:hypothetical protein
MAKPDEPTAEQVSRRRLRASANIMKAGGSACGPEPDLELFRLVLARRIETLIDT